MKNLADIMNKSIAGSYLKGFLPELSMIAGKQLLLRGDRD
jgi:hypothetical protein